MTKSVLSRSVLMAGHSMTRAPAFFIVSRTFLPFCPRRASTTRADVGVGSREEREQVELELVGRLVEVAHDDRLGAAEERGLACIAAPRTRRSRRAIRIDLDVGR